MMKRPCVLALSILPSCYGLVAGNRSESRRRRQDRGLCVKTGTRIRNGSFLWRRTTQGKSVWKTDAWQAASYSWCWDPPTQRSQGAEGPCRWPVEPAALSSVAYPYYGNAPRAGSHQPAHEGDDRAIRRGRGNCARVHRRDVRTGRHRSTVAADGVGLAGHRHVGSRLCALLFREAHARHQEST